MYTKKSTCILKIYFFTSNFNVRFLDICIAFTVSKIGSYFWDIPWLNTQILMFFCPNLKTLNLFLFLCVFHRVWLWLRLCHSGGWFQESIQSTSISLFLGKSNYHANLACIWGHRQSHWKRLFTKIGLSVQNFDMESSWYTFIGKHFHLLSLSIAKYVFVFSIYNPLILIIYPVFFPEMSEDLLQYYVDPCVLRHPGGHFIPASGPQKQVYGNFLSKMMDRKKKRLVEQDIWLISLVLMIYVILKVCRKVTVIKTFYLLYVLSLLDGICGSSCCWIKCVIIMPFCQLCGF